MEEIEISESDREAAKWSFKAIGLPEPNEQQIKLWTVYSDKGYDFGSAAIWASKE